jgi:hypothetical protein
MVTPSWHASGQYYETCSCDFVCPCVPGQLAVEPTKGSCTFAMGKGNWSVGVIADARAHADQRDAITAIASGSAGGPMAALSGLVGTFLGVELAPIRFDRKGAKWSVTAEKFVDMAAKGPWG